MNLLESLIFRVKLRFLVGIVALFFGLSPTPSYATVCLRLMLNQFPDPFEIVLKHTDVVFIGEVEAIKQTTFEAKDFEKPLTTESSVIFNISETLAGEKRSQGVIYYNPEKTKNHCGCNHNYIVGENYLVFASIKIIDEKEFLSTSFCDYIKIENSEEADQLIDKLRKFQSDHAESNK